MQVITFLFIPETADGEQDGGERDWYVDGNRNRVDGYGLQLGVGDLLSASAVQSSAVDGLVVADGLQLEYKVVRGPE